MSGSRMLRLFVGNLPWTVGQRQLVEYFNKFGVVANTKVMFNKETGFSRGYGFVEYRNMESLESCMTQPGHELEGRKLEVLSVTEQQGQRRNRGFQQNQDQYDL
ncbi:unnamed protein product [Owenia fusiformis]|uniref:RRM domain-containing protein n=1 Tax=Owenia fusiformis TaxID=6347 RepID=A0A8S4PFV1_OWEFU|nr:unnamed protein product [Owenia fusiformis]